METAANTLPESVRSKLLKIQALAERGAPGEREAAQEALQTLCQKHGVSLLDLADDARDWRPFKVEPALAKIFTQCACFILRTNTVTWRRGSRRSFRYLNVTVSEEIDLRECFQFYALRWQEELAALQTAFFSKHRLFSGVDSDEEPEPMDPEKLAKVRAMLRGLSGNSWQKPSARLNA